MRTHCTVRITELAVLLTIAYWDPGPTLRWRNTTLYYFYHALVLSVHASNYPSTDHIL